MPLVADRGESVRALTWFRALLGLRVAAEALLGLAWLAVPVDLWSVVTQVRIPLEKPWLDPFRLIAFGAAAGLIWALGGAVAGRRCLVDKAVAWLAVGGALGLSVARAWVVGWLPPNAGLRLLLAADFGCVIALAVLLRAACVREERLGWRTIASVVRRIGAALRRGASCLRRPACAAAAVVALLSASSLAGVFWFHLLRAAPEPQFSSDEEHFNHAPLGNGRSRGLPLYLWEVLPEAFADKLPWPDGWASFGLLTAPGESLPVGVAVRTNGFPMVGFNCALCHTASYRLASDGARQNVPGGPASRLDLSRLLAFLSESAADPRFTADELLPRIESRHRLTRVERALYRHLIIPLVRESLLLAGRDFAWARLRPPAGPGRVDSINILKLNLLRLPDDGSIGATDYMPVWNQGAEAAYLHGWNGSGSGADANLLAAAFLQNFDPGTFHQANFDRMVRFLADLAPPDFPGQVNASIAAHGRQIFERNCAECHAADGARVGQITPGDELGTDDHYLKTWRPDLVDWLKAMKRGPFVFPGLRRSDGFVNLPLTGLWLRGPYLHNGSVPTVADLLRPPEQRPTSFIRGYDVVDLERLGYVSSGAAAEKDGFRQNNHLLGNGNAGHRYGTDLADEDRRALIEYLKTL